MKVAQRCPYCKEIFISPKRRLDCPFCEHILPEKKQGNISKRKPIPAKDAKLIMEIFGEKPSTEIIKEFVGVREQVQLLYNLVYGFLTKNNTQIKSKKLSSEELCDFGFICRGLEKVFDELRKEVKARKELCGSIIAYRLTQAVVMDPSLKMKVNGQFATGTPDVKMQAALPKKQSVEYYQLTDFLGVPRSVAEAGVLKLDWKNVTEMLTKLVKDGLPIPAGFGKQYPSYVTVYRKRTQK